MVESPSEKTAALISVVTIRRPLKTACELKVLLVYSVSSPKRLISTSNCVDSLGARLNSRNVTDKERRKKMESGRVKERDGGQQRDSATTVLMFSHTNTHTHSFEEIT